MPVFDPLVQAQLQERRGVDAHVLVWIEARRRDTGATEAIGFWTGDDHQVFTIGGQDRTYYGAGGIASVSEIRATTGLEVIHHRIELPPLLDEVQQLLRNYDARQARAQVHSAVFDIDTGQLLAAPVRFVKGRVQEAPETLAGTGGRSKTVIKIASSARALTQGLPLYKSDEAQRGVSSADRGREYVHVAEDFSVPWGGDE